jgi:hypothetical protein
MILFCPRCGAPLSTEMRGEWFNTKDQCTDCGVAVLNVPLILKPSADDVRYALDEWPPPDRAAITATLQELDAPYRWEPGLILVVPAAAETDLDQLLNDFEPLGEDDLDGGEAAGDGGEEAHAAMADLFLAADRLQHVPWDKALAADLSRAATAVGESLPPYGIELKVWRHIQKMAAAAAESASEEIVDDEVASADSRALRDLLRDYV